MMASKSLWMDIDVMLSEYLAPGELFIAGRTEGRMRRGGPAGSGKDRRLSRR